MPKVALYNTQGEQVGDVELSDSVFGQEISPELMHIVVKNYLANQRQGTASTLTRAEVAGGGRKPWRQKGTGRARHGSIRSPIWRKGGIVFGPKPRSYKYTLPKKLRRKALLSALSSKVEDDEIIVLEKLDLEAPKTKEMTKALDALKADRKSLIVLESKNENVEKSVRNIPGVKAVTVNILNVYDVLAHDNLIITEGAARKVEEVYAG